MHSRFLWNFEIWSKNPQTNFAPFLLLKDIYIREVEYCYSIAQHTSQAEFLHEFLHNKKKLTSIQTKVLASRSPRKSTKLIKLELKSLVNVPKKFEDESCIFLEVIAEQSRGDKKNPRNFPSKYDICESTKISRGESLRIFPITSVFFCYNKDLSGGG